MRKLTLFSRLAAFLLTAMMTLPWQAFAQLPEIPVTINCKMGEIYSGEWASHIFKGDTENSKPSETYPSANNISIYPVELPEQDEHGDK
jgi:hypothetical protein